MRNLDMAEELDLNILALRAETPLDVTGIHDLLLQVESQLGRHPNQILGPHLRVRWHLGTSELLELGITPLLKDDGGPWWRVEVMVHDRNKLLGEEHLALKHASDLDMTSYGDMANSDPPYLWNMRVCEHRQWDQDFLTPVLSWAELCRHVSDMVGNLPLELAALPTEWCDHEIVVADPYYYFQAVASRDGLQVKLTRMSPEGGDMHALMIPATVAPEAGPLLLTSYAANFGQGFPLHHIELRDHVQAIGSTGWFSGFSVSTYLPRNNTEMEENRDYFERHRKIIERLEEEPDYASRLDDLVELSEWHRFFPEAIGLDDVPDDFPQWRDPMPRG